ncbi:MAG: hypothetical protein A2756_05520 [Candidatus Ryanbacteria bacterium RIFCSPHIGHO2_01_FULL_48_27]|uniref:Calcineurin-like phosphoesterase domain-containing protein n=1 Tax=Candidatus Ryanbacteria bacterium RIFCSPHIGHO2_01_FULL_48_27 TaxID=1802115 RepID=A0A1G2G1G0_9BACT|nr:MAG: hypothetical protein A2756_05520 [Candidatus Ryanbacteria bacterium RIFCSPHIGHO2_01_FULL_48_27]
MQYILGDLHANIRELERLLRQLSPASDDTFIFLGDYIDKLPHTAETLALLHALRREHTCVFVKGNHEFVWERYVLSQEKERGDFLREFGGREALQGFGRDVQNALLQNDFSVLQHALVSYFDLMTMMVDWHRTGEYLALHAGLLPEQYDQPSPRFLEKNFFVRPQDIPRERKYLNRYTLVAGHTHLGTEPTVEEGYINIDLGAGYGKFLGALCVEEQIVVRSDGEKFPIPKPEKAQKVL